MIYFFGKYELKSLYPLILTIVLVVGVGNISAQDFSKDFWHSGEIDLNTSETFVGNLKYDLDRNIIQLDMDGIIKTFTPKNSAAFQFQDALENKTRYFFSLPYSGGGYYKQPVFFELLKEGNTSLLSRERVEERVRAYHDPFWTGGRNVTTVYLIDYFFLMDEEGNIEAVKSEIDDVVRLLRDKEKSLRDYVKKNRLELTYREDMVQLIEYYNGLPN